MKTKLTTLTVAAICAANNPARAQEPPPGDIQPQTVVPCVVALGCLAGGVWIAWELKKFCDHNLPPAAPPPPPATNAPPAKTKPPGIKSASVESAASVSTITGHYAPDGTEYNRLLVFTVETSANLTDWQTLTITGYVSPTFVLLQCRTNASLQANTGNWSVDFELPESSCRFFRSTP